MKKFTLILLAIILLIGVSVALYFVPFKELASSLPLLKEIYNNTELTINTPKGKATIYVDGQEYGETPTTISNLKEGTHLIELERITESPNAYKKQSFYIDLYRNTESIIDVEIGPKDFLSGYIVYYSVAPKSGNSEGFMTLKVNTNDYKIKVDGEEQTVEQSKTQIIKAGQHELEISAKTYESVKFPIIIREGYNLNVQAYLLPIPIKLDMEQ